MICCECKKEVFRSRYIPKTKEWKCMDCANVSSETVFSSVFPFTTTNLSKDPTKPVTVNSLHHLRRLEREHGVQSVAFNQDSHNFNDPLRGR